MSTLRPLVQSMIVFLASSFLAGCGSSSSSSSGTGSVGISIVDPVYGLDFSPFTDGSDPSHGATVSAADIEAKVAKIAPYTHAIRTYGTTGGLEHAGAAAHRHGLIAIVTAWIGSDPVANGQQIAGLVAMAAAGDVDVALIGSEVLLRNDLSPAQLIALIDAARAQLPPGIPVATADSYTSFLNNPALVSAVDRIYANYYPYWSGIHIDNAVAEVHYQHQQVLSIAQGKSVIVSETGWPSGGNTIAQAEATPANAARYFHNVAAWARAEGIDMIYFECFDEPWKAQYEQSQGAHWGLFDASGNLKTGMGAAFDGSPFPDNWTLDPLPGGPGIPMIEFSYLPPIGSNANLEGIVRHVLPSAYRVLVYIKVAGSWWSKPTFAQPQTTISITGSFVTDITTGGNDASATEVAAFVVPADLSPPLAAGAAAIPFATTTAAVASIQVVR